MNAQDIKIRLKALKQSIGERADVYCSLDASYSDKPVRVAAYAEGVCGSVTFSVEASDFDLAIIAAEEKWAECRDRIEARQIMDMALQIIRITAEQGACTDAALRVENFSNADILRLGARACAKADEIAGGGPFAIKSEAEANAV